MSDVALLPPGLTYMDKFNIIITDSDDGQNLQNENQKQIFQYLRCNTMYIHNFPDLGQTGLWTLFELSKSSANTLHMEDNNAVHFKELLL